MLGTHTGYEYPEVATATNRVIPHGSQPAESQVRQRRWVGFQLGGGAEYPGSSERPVTWRSGTKTTRSQQVYQTDYPDYLLQALVQGDVANSVGLSTAPR